MRDQRSRQQTHLRVTIEIVAGNQKPSKIPDLIVKQDVRTCGRRIYDTDIPVGMYLYSYDSVRVDLLVYDRSPCLAVDSHVFVAKR